jgi:hypothetical protein
VGGGAGHEPPWRCRSARAPRWCMGGSKEHAVECLQNLTAGSEGAPGLPSRRRRRLGVHPRSSAAARHACTGGAVELRSAALRSRTEAPWPSLTAVDRASRARTWTSLPSSSRSPAIGKCSQEREDVAVREPVALTPAGGWFWRAPREEGAGEAAAVALPSIVRQRTRGRGGRRRSAEGQRWERRGRVSAGRLLSTLGLRWTVQIY